MDKNDKMHPDMTPLMLKDKRAAILEGFEGDEFLTDIMMRKIHIEPGYRQYFVCDECMAVQERIEERKQGTIT
ncbi:MAG: hypothetical protein GY861_17435 [bacterium]|nr:hypothetical protein [bacterium]